VTISSIDRCSSRQGTCLTPRVGDDYHLCPYPVLVAVQQLDSANAPLRALLVDDELPTLAELRWLLDRDERIGAVQTATSGTEALRLLQSEPVDVVFCDISMPGLDGLDLARVLGRFADPPQVVFVTAHDQHAVDAFDLHATDYVMKPVRDERLSEAVRRVHAKHDGLSGGTVREPGVEPAVEDETIPVELGGVTTFLQRSQIRYAQAQGDYARLHTAKQSHLVRVSLNSLEERWAGAGFVRIHRSTLVSTAYIVAVTMQHGRCSVSLGDVELQVSRRHTRELRERLMRARAT